MMLFPEIAPRILSLPPGADFPERLTAGLIRRLGPGDPLRMARVTLILNTQRMRRRVREAFRARGAMVLPRLRVLSDLAEDPLLLGAGARVSALGRRLELAVLIDRLLEAEPDLAPRAALYDLADSLAGLMDEMQAEGVDPGRLDRLDMEGHAAHWARTRRFVSLVERFFTPDAAPDAEARMRRAVAALSEAWAAHLPQDPVILAGSTGSRGSTLALMRAVAALPQGAVLLPGFDPFMPRDVWASLDLAGADVTGQEDHPQYRHWRLIRDLGLDPAALPEWESEGAPDPARNRLLSLALRPAPVTDQWISEGPGLGDLREATAQVTLIEASQPRAEARAIALRLRLALAEGKTAALISPDRELTRQVSAALDRWAIRPDDSAGRPLMHSAPGRLLRMLARGMGRKLPADQCLALLKHPLAFSGAERGPHLLLLRELELRLRRKGPAWPDAAFLKNWAEARKEELAPRWATRVGAVLKGLEAVVSAPLGKLVAQHRALAEELSRDLAADEGSGALWQEAAGVSALAAMDELAAEAPEGFTVSLRDYAVLLDGVFSRSEVREAQVVDTRLQILGTQEARIERADLVILAGLNEGVWPAKPSPDPWLNRKMRVEAGLLLPERAIGLSAHDFQIAAAAPEVVLSRAARDAEAETVPSRWVNRLTNLLEGLAENYGPEALADMRARGQRLLAEAEALERPWPSPRARRPSPRPPVAARPQRLSLTEVERLIRDPYAIHARHVLRLDPLPDLRTLADARLRGEVLHRVPELFLKTRPLPEDPQAAADLLMAITDQVLEEDVAWPATRAAWRARMADLARDFVEGVLAHGSDPVAMERKYHVDIPGLGFRLVGKPDRLDMMPDGRLLIVDYKTGTPPSKEQQQVFAKQLHLAALMASLGAFPEVGPLDTIRISYVQLKKGLKDVTSDLGPEDLETIQAEFRRLIEAWREPGRGYTSRRAMLEARDRGDYDDLARYGEWDLSDPATPEDMA